MNRSNRLYIVVWLCGVLVAGMAFAADAPEQPEAFDPELAEALGADEYGMRRYVMAFLKTGPNPDHDPETARELQAGHMANIRRLAGEGKLVVAGPFLGEGPFRGIFILDVATVEEARALVETDPAVRAGRLEMELYPWYGSAALRKVNGIHHRISRSNP